MGQKWRKFKDRMGNNFNRPAPTSDKAALLSLANLSLEERSTCTSFDDMKLKPGLHRGILTEGFDVPSEIQAKAVPFGIQGHDLIMQAQSGMGKTHAMLLILLQKIDISLRCTQAVILTPTRELAIQINEAIKRVSQYMGGVTSIACYGGVSRNRRMREKVKILEGCHIVVATLGRIRALMTTNERQLPPLILDGTHLKLFAIDEADKMLIDHSYKRDLQKVFEFVSGDAQLILMSATMPLGALETAKQVCIRPKIFQVSETKLTLEGIRQFYIDVGSNPAAKVDILAEILPVLQDRHSFIFCNTRDGVNDLTNKLRLRGIAAFGIEGEFPQGERERILNDFRRGVIKALISSDLLSRGIDVQQVSVVINFDLPESVHEYIHRVGRSGRYGRKGLAITFITGNQLKDLQELEKHYNTFIPETTNLNASLRAF